MTDDQTPPDQTDTSDETPASRFPELDELQQEVARRLRDNQRFLEHFLDEDFPDDSEEESEEIDPDDFEEL